jgi:hypothetical protein
MCARMLHTDLQKVTCGLTRRHLLLQLRHVQQIVCVNKPRQLAHHRHVLRVSGGTMAARQVGAPWTRRWTLP